MQDDILSLTDSNYSGSSDSSIEPKYEESWS
jgi:hypothetical protein